MNVYDVLIAACWAIFLIVWIIGSLSTKHALQAYPYKRRPIYRFGAVALILLLLYLSSTHGSWHFLFAPTTINPVVGVIGVILAALGVSFAIWARFYLGRNWGVPMTLREGHELVMTGPYHLVRHPIYTGVLVALLGAVVTEGQLWLIPFIFFIIYFNRSAETEEGHLLERFPDTYPSYISRTKKFIPFIF